MDELELLKRDWKKNDSNFTQVSENEIYKMQFKSSGSIVKWIFIISVIELLLAPIIGLLFNGSESYNALEKYHIKTIMTVWSIINYVVIVYFIYKFYVNYKSINANDTVKGLLKNIINTRKTVKNYVTYNLIMGTIAFVIIFISTVLYEPKIIELIKQIGGAKGYLVVFLAYFVLFGVLMIIIWLFYKLIYGLLIRRLNRNYKELEKIEF